MICKKCMSQISDNETVCPNCGTNMTSTEEVQQTQTPYSTEFIPNNQENIYNTEQNIQQVAYTHEGFNNSQPLQTQAGGRKAKKEKPSKSFGKAKAILIVILLIIIAGGVYYALSIFDVIPSPFNSPIGRFEGAITQGDYTRARELYVDEIMQDRDKRSDAERIVLARAEELRTTYIEEDTDYDETLAQLQALIRLGVTGERDIIQMIEDINEMRTSRISYENGLEKLSEGDYVAALNALRKVIQSDVNYSDAQNHITDATRLYKEQILREADNLQAEGQYDEAISALRIALTIVPEDADFLNKISDIEALIDYELSQIIEDIIRAARQKAASGDYEGALLDVENAQAEYDGSEIFNSVIAEIKEEYITYILGEASVLAGESLFEEAIALLNEALVIVPDNAMLISTIAEYETKLPILIQDFQEIAFFFNGTELRNAGQMTDNTNQLRDNVVDDVGIGFRNTYKINGGFSRITGVLFLPYDDRNETNTSELSIYGDEQLLFQASMKGGIEPVEFDVDLTDVIDLVIQFNNGFTTGGQITWANPSGSLNYYIFKSRLADVKLYPAVD